MMLTCKNGTVNICDVNVRITNLVLTLIIVQFRFGYTFHRTINPFWMFQNDLTGLLDRSEQRLCCSVRLRHAHYTLGSRELVQKVNTWPN
jgi:hypothetical protein